jgi:hypothetical protein
MGQSSGKRHAAKNRTPLTFFVGKPSTMPTTVKKLHEYGCA